MKIWKRNKWILIGTAFPYDEEYRLFNPRLERYLKAGTSYKRAVRWKHKLNNK